jgi:hypothetical protein
VESLVGYRSNPTDGIRISAKISKKNRKSDAFRRSAFSVLGYTVVIEACCLAEQSDETARGLRLGALKLGALKFGVLKLGA